MGFSAVAKKVEIREDDGVTYVSIEIAKHELETWIESLNHVLKDNCNCCPGIVSEKEYCSVYVIDMD